jgi:NAD(P)H-flavin reductase
MGGGGARHFNKTQKHCIMIAAKLGVSPLTSTNIFCSCVHGPLFGCFVPFTSSIIFISHTFN